MTPIWQAIYEEQPVFTPEGVECIVVDFSMGKATVRARFGNDIKEAILPVDRLSLTKPK